MVDQRVLEYLRMNRGNYPLDALKKKILASGYSQADIDHALIQLNKQSKGNVPGVASTINKINKTNLPLEKLGNGSKKMGKSAAKPSGKKSKKWLWIILIIVLVLLLAGGGFAAWWFYLK